VWIGAATLAATLGAGAVTSATHWGTTDEKIATLQNGQDSIDKKLDDHAEQLAKERAADAQIGQQLNDVLSRLDRIERKLDGSRGSSK
jgi:ribosomal protein S4